METKGFRINLLGTSFTITTDENPDYLDRILAYYTKKVEEIESAGSTKDPLRIAILAGFLVSDDLFRNSESGNIEEQRREELSESITRGIIDRIDSVLDET